MADDSTAASSSGPQASGAVAADHAPAVQSVAFLARSTLSDKAMNTIARYCYPVACWGLPDACFEFDSAFVMLRAQEGFSKLAQSYHKWRLACYIKYGGALPRVAIFGHADPVGKDAYNKTLSEARAKAVYGVLTRDIAAWNEVFPDTDRLSQRLEAAGSDPNTAGGLDQAIKQHMDRLCGGFELKAADFLDGGAHAYQGCGEFNPVVVFSGKEAEEFRDAKKKAERDIANAPNRRVVAFIFEPEPPMLRWPCKPAPDVAACTGQYVSDAKRRRQNQEKRREHHLTHDTFTCRFYNRLFGSSPCEGRGPAAADPLLVYEMRGLDHHFGRFSSSYRVFPDPTAITHRDRDQGDGSGTITPGEQGNVIQQSEGVRSDSGDPSAATKFATDGAPYSKYAGKIVEVRQGRREVMHLKPGVVLATGPTADDLKGDQVYMMDAFYATERQFIEYTVFTKKEDFDSELRKQPKGGASGAFFSAGYRTNRLLILWDPEKRQVLRYALDGEELPPHNFGSIGGE